MKRGRKPGFKHSEETKQKMSAKKLGVAKSPEHTQHNKEAQTGCKIITLYDGTRHRVKVNSYEELVQVALEKNWWVGKQELEEIWGKIKPTEK